MRISTELENIKKNQRELKNTIPKIKSKLERIHKYTSRLDDTEEGISEMEDSVVEITQAKQKKEKKRIKKNEDSLHLDNIKCINILMIGIPEEGEEKRTENLFEK